jgi:uncharacterized damage-inducible protein DinB
MANSEMANFFETWDRVHKQSVKVMSVAPSDKFDWQPVDSAMTLGDLVRHLPQAELFLVGLTTGKKPAERDFSSLKTTEEVVEAFKQTHEECKKVVSEMSESELNENVTLGPNTMPKRVLLHGMLEHEIHHRGQLYTYVRIAGVIPPPLFGGV